MICTCVFCPEPPMDDDWPLPVVAGDGRSHVIKPTHRYCILVDVLGQEIADQAWGDRRKPGEVGPPTWDQHDVARW